MMVSVNEQDIETASEPERAVVAGMLHSEAMADAVSLIVSGEHFDNPVLGAVANHILNLRAAGRFYADEITLQHELEKMRVAVGRCNVTALEAMGGRVRLLKLLYSAPTEHTIGEHAHEVVNGYHLRRLRTALQSSLDRCNSDSVNAAEELRRLESMTASIVANTETVAPTMVSDLLSKLADDMDVARLHGDQTGIPTGFRNVDRLTGGFFPGEITVLGAWTSMGKTAFAMQVAMANAMSDTPRPTLVLSLEMKELQMAHRIAASELGMSVRDLRSGEHDEQDASDVRRLSAQLGGVPLGILSSRHANVARLRANALAFRASHGLDFLVIDYLQLISAAKPRDERRLQVEQISNDLKSLAMELNIPILALCQLNRDNEGSGRPDVKNLRESAAIGQDADAVWFVHRTDRSSPDAELIIQKNRQGPTFTEPLRYDGARFRFADQQ